MMTLGWMNFLMMVRVWLIEPNFDRLCFEVVEIDDEMRCQKCVGVMSEKGGCWQAPALGGEEVIF